MERQNLFAKKRVVVMQGGKVVEIYDSMREFREAYPVTVECVISRRLTNHVDGWLEDGKIARYEGDEDAEGRQIQPQKGRPMQVSDRKRWTDDLAETEAKIKEAYELCDRGEITYEERAQRLGWLQNHVYFLKRRLGIKDKDIED
jgi:hypothetical protein